MSAQQIACPACSSPVHFRSSLTLYASCPSCRALLLRKDAQLEKIGEVGDLHPDGSILRLGSQGVCEGVAFYIVGRMQLKVVGNSRDAVGYWNEWCAHFSDGRLGWIGEAQGQFFVSFIDDSRAAPIKKLTSKDATTGRAVTIDNVAYIVTSSGVAEAGGLEGELPFFSEEGFLCCYADLSSTTSRAATIDFSDGEPVLYLGRWYEFDDLKWTNLRGTEPDGQAFSESSALLQKLTCKGCGASFELKNPGVSQSLACEYCGTVTDLQSGSHERLFKSLKKLENIGATLKLGTIMKFGFDANTPFECIGFIQKSTRVDGYEYRWKEYLLFHRYKGYRWLVESNGHWLFVETMRELPQDSVGLPVDDPVHHPVLKDGQLYRHFQSCKANVDIAAGEFYYQVTKGQQSVCRDYVSPPYLLSLEVSDELNWSKGTYISYEEIQSAASLTTPLAEPAGIGPSQPNPYDAWNGKNWKLVKILAAVGFVALCMLSMVSRTPTWKQDLVYRQYELERSQVFPIQMTGRTRNLELEVAVGPEFQDRWAFFHLSLINLTTQEALDCGAQVDRFQGRGGKRATSMLPSVAPGQYLLRVEPQSGTGEMPDKNGTQPLEGVQSPTVFTYQLKIYRDVPQWSFFFYFLLAISLPPLWWSYRSSQFETKRWSESDHAQDEDDE
jgi:hypothetical protein